MTRELSQLLETLGQQTELMRALVDLLQQDRASIVAHDIAALEASNQQKEALVLQLHAAERARQLHCEQVARTLELPPGELRVSVLCEHLGADGARLHTTAEKLRAVVGSLRELVAVSHGFLEQSILGIRGLLGLIASLRSPTASTYDASGQIASPGVHHAVALRQEV